MVVAPTEPPRRPDLAPGALAERVRAVACVDIAAVFVVPALPVDKRHNSKIDRTRVGVGERGARRRTDTQAVKVLVTGATSLLGGAVAERLQARGDDVSVFQRRPSGLGFARCSATSPIGERSRPRSPESRS